MFRHLMGKNKQSKLQQFSDIYFMSLTKRMIDAVKTWKHFPHYWPVVRGIHRSAPLTKASNMDLWFFSLLSSSSCRWFETSYCSSAWWRHRTETNIFRVTGLCAGNSPVTGELPSQRPVTRSFDVFFDLRPNKWLSKQLWGWWFETPSHSL